MDGESNYESDISESWSLIDLNLNEESVNLSESHSLVNSKESLPIKVKLKKANSSKTNGSKKKLDIRDEPACSISTESDSDLPLKNELCLTLFEGKSVKTTDEEGNSRNNEEGIQNYSSDGESIEILEPDTDFEKLDITVNKSRVEGTDNSDDEESQEENNDRAGTSYGTTLKRKRRKLSRDSDSSKKSTNSNFTSLKKKYNLDTNFPRTDKSIQELRVQKYVPNGQPVYKHYRNNVANTVLSLLMGVIFAAVACIAIGHFLGVHEAEETAGELMESLKKLQIENLETLKKLQVKNFLLQSRLRDVKRAFYTRDIHPKIESEVNKIQMEKLFKMYKNFVSKTMDENQMNELPQYKIDPSVKAWGVFEKNLIDGKEFLNKNNLVDRRKLVKYIHDLGMFLKKDKIEEIRLKHLELSKGMQNFLSRLSSVQDNIENLYQKFLKKKNQNIQRQNKAFPDFLDKNTWNINESVEDSSNIPFNLPMIDRDFCSFQWNLNRKETKSVKLNKQSMEISENSVLVYKFPQPKDYYRVKGNDSCSGYIDFDETDKKPTGMTNSSETYKESDSLLGRSQFNTGKMKGKVEWESETVLVKEIPKNEKKREKKLKNVNVYKVVKKNVDKRGGSSEIKYKNVKLKKDKNVKDKKKYQRRKAKQVRNVVNDKERKSNGKQRQNSRNSLKKNKLGLDETKTKKQRKKRSKMKKQIIRDDFKRKIFRIKRRNSKFKRIVLSKLINNPEGSHPKENRKDEFCSLNGHRLIPRFNGGYFNLTGDWVFKWAGGREEFRRHQIRGDWQFERAKGRKELRNEDIDANWQFKRATARETDRNFESSYYDRFRFRNYNGNGFEFEKYKDFYAF